MKQCVKCILNDNIPSVTIGENGLCNYCASEKKHRVRPLNEDRLLEITKGGDKPYQVLLAYSGGKDSSYTLKLLREKYGFSVLAVTFDNGFMSERCAKNIRTVTSVLGVDHITIRYAFPDMCRLFSRASKSDDIFPVKALERASAICIACISLVKAVMYREAILREIPIICFGWTPGQIGLANPLIKLDYQMILANQQQISRGILSLLGERFGRFFIDPQWLRRNRDHIPYLYYPFVMNEYDEEKIIRSIQAIGWEMEQETDANSTNCLLNTYANHIHMNRFGYHPYCMELASLVRQGIIERDEALEKIRNAGSLSNVERIGGILSRYG